MKNHHLVINPQNIFRDDKKRIPVENHYDAIFPKSELSWPHRKAMKRVSQTQNKRKYKVERSSPFEIDRKLFPIFQLNFKNMIKNYWDFMDIWGFKNSMTEEKRQKEKTSGYANDYLRHEKPFLNADTIFSESSIKDIPHYK